MPLPSALRNFEAHLDIYDATDERHLRQDNQSVRALKRTLMRLAEDLEKSTDAIQRTELREKIRSTDDALFSAIYGSPSKPPAGAK